MFRTYLAEPRAPGAPRRVWRDWFVAAALVIGSVIEALVRDDVPWPIPTLVASALVAVTMFWRRQHPLMMTLAAFAIVDVLSLAVWIDGGSAAGFYSMAWILVVPYSLFRWGSGRETSIGMAVMLVAWAVGITTDPGTLGEAIGGFAVLALTAVLGMTVRYRGTARRRELEEAKLREREQLARELHDSVAHHVSAIAVQAQAGQAIAADRPEAAAEVLAVIEDAAKRTLSEMRTMVGALRNSDDPELAPLQGVGDLPRLARTASGSMVVDVDLSGHLSDLGPTVDAAVYRIAQESITNALRHARNASHVNVRVVGEADGVELTVANDGDAVSFDAAAVTGYGLLGMTERAKLLGGTLTAGPAPGGGWTIVARLPRSDIGAEVTS